MACAEEQITIEHDGQKHSAKYIVDGGVVSVMMKDVNGGYRGTSTFVDGSGADAVAKSLFWELLRDVGFF